MRLTATRYTNTVFAPHINTKLFTCYLIKSSFTLENKMTVKALRQLLSNIKNQDAQIAVGMRTTNRTNIFEVDNVQIEVNQNQPTVIIFNL